MSMVETATSTTVSAIEPLDSERCSAVRFETQCVVIPDPAHRSRRPRVVTKSLALPLWKRWSSSSGPSISAPPEDTSEESHLVLRVPVPTFSLKRHSTARSVDHTPLPPCLVHRPQPSGPSCASTPSSRHSHASRKHSPSPSRSDIVTVPLRPCCAACLPVTDAALVGSDAWSEHLSRAASRPHSMSADARSITVAGSAVSSSYGALGVSMSVEEIDKRRRSSDIGPSTTSRETLWFDNVKAKEECRVPLILRRTAASSSSAADARGPPSPNCRIPRTPRIPEEEDDENENEHELFPLPSPKRLSTPTVSPGPSPAGSLSSLVAARANQSSTTSPTPSICSGDSASLLPSKRHFLAPPPCSSSSSLSLPKLSESTTDLTLTEDPPRTPSPSLLSGLPPLSGRLRSRSPSPRISFVPPTPTADTSFPAADTAPSKIPQSPKSIAIPSSPGSSQLSISPHHSPTHVRFRWRPRRSVSVDAISPTTPSRPLSCSPSASTILSSSSNTKKPFLMASPRHIIADVLRGVGAIGSSGVAPGL